MHDNGGGDGPFRDSTMKMNRTDAWPERKAAPRDFGAALRALKVTSGEVDLLANVLV